MWMSDARDSTARAIIRLTKRMTGASLAKSFRCWICSSSVKSSAKPMESTI